MAENTDPRIRLSDEAYLYFVRRALEGMRRIVLDLGDALASSRPGLPGSNSPYGLLTHCLGVVEYWGGYVVAGRSIQRDREAEFVATGRVDQLAARVEPALAQLAADLATVEPGAPVRHQPDAWADGPDLPLDAAGALTHLYEEIAQHHGQMELIRDALLAEGRAVGLDSLPETWLRGKRGVKWRRPGPDALPAWVADMDFPVAPPIRAAVTEVLARGDLGYPDWTEPPLAAAFAERMTARYGWEPPVDQVRSVSDLIQALQIVLTLATEPGDGVLVHLPTYPPFLETITCTGRVLVPIPLVPVGDGSWGWDDDALERALRETRAKVLLVVNPHNPTGRVFDRAELSRLADLAERHDLLVVADEIHAELAYEPNVHVPFASLDPAIAARTVTVTSATKAFNIAGVRTAVAHVGPPSLRKAWDAQPPDLFGASNVLGVEATLAAWRHGDAWLDDVRRHLRDRRDHVVRRLATTPITLRPPQGTYLAWLDCGACGIDGSPASWFLEQAGVQLSPGPDFGPGNEQRARLNFATSADVLDRILDRLLGALPG